GILGMAAVGIFASPKIMSRYPVESAPEPGLIYGHAAQLQAQWIGIAAIIVFTIAAVAVPVLILNWVGWLRISALEEEKGSDEPTHGEEGESKEPEKKDNSGKKGEGEDEGREPQP